MIHNRIHSDGLISALNLYWNSNGLLAHRKSASVRATEHFLHWQQGGMRVFQATNDGESDSLQS